jgi:hypothetical protein
MAGDEVICSNLLKSHVLISERGMDWGQPLTRDKQNDRVLLKECKGEDIYGATFAD